MQDGKAEAETGLVGKLSGIKIGGIIVLHSETANIAGYVHALDAEKIRMSVEHPNSYMSQYRLSEHQVEPADWCHLNKFSSYEVMESYGTDINMQNLSVDIGDIVSLRGKNGLVAGYVTNLEKGQITIAIEDPFKKDPHMWRLLDFFPPTASYLTKSFDVYSVLRKHLRNEAKGEGSSQTIDLSRK